MSIVARRAATLVALVVVALGVTWGCRHSTPDAVRTEGRTGVHPGPAADPSASSVGPPRPGAQVPRIRPSPRYLERTYHAPRRLVAVGAGGTLSIPSLGLQVPVDSVGLDGTAMALPDDPARVGWLNSTAAVADRVGSSVISGHVSDSHDVPGALVDLEEIRPGASIVWAGYDGTRTVFEVTGLREYPRATGVPAALFRTDGPRLLRVVTCADRQQTAGGGFHYAANLVVTARAVGAAT